MFFFKIIICNLQAYIFEEYVYVCDQSQQSNRCMIRTGTA